MGLELFKSMFNPWGIIGVAAWLLTSCSAPPSQSQPAVNAVPLPQSWQATHPLSQETDADTINPQEQTPWWVSFENSQLNALISEALQANPDALSAASSIREARAYRQQVEGRAWPSLALGAQANRQSSQRSGVTQTQYQTALDASWEVDLFGQQAAASSAADAQLQASQADYAALRVSLAAEVAQTYLRIQGLSMQIALTEQGLNNWQESLQLTEWQAKAGLVTELDVEQARRSYQQTLASLPELQQSLNEANQSLALLLGRYHFSQSVKTVLPKVSETFFLPVPANALRQRPDVKAAEKRLLAAYFTHQQTEAGRYPRLTLSGSLGLTAATLSGLTAGQALFSSLGAGLSYSLFDFGQLEAQIKVASEQEQQAWLSYRKVLLQAVQETENALQGLYHSRLGLQALAKALQASEKEERLALIQYQTGQVSFSDVLLAQRTRLSLQQQHIEAQVTELTRLITLYKSLAGKWAWQSPDPSASITIPREVVHESTD